MIHIIASNAHYVPRRRTSCASNIINSLHGLRQTRALVPCQKGSVLVNQESHTVKPQSTAEAMIALVVQY